jgi:hypothetical protein
MGNIVFDQLVIHGDQVGLTLVTAVDVVLALGHLLVAFSSVKV